MNLIMSAMYCQNKDPFGYYKLAGKILKPSDGTNTYPIKGPDGHVVTDLQQKLNIFGDLYEEIYTPPPETNESRENTIASDRFFNEIGDEFSEVRRRPARRSWIKPSPQIRSGGRYRKPSRPPRVKTEYPILI